MKIRYLDDSEIIVKAKALVDSEKKITLEILEYLKEIENRRLFLARGFSSLFEFCIKELGYSEGAANRRISSMRLLRQLPEVKQKLMESKVNLSTLTQLHSHIRREEKIAASKISREDKIHLLNQIESKSQDECQKELLKNSTHPHMALEREKIISDDLTEIRFSASNELMAKFKLLKGLLAHKNFQPSWSEFFEILADEVLRSKDLKNENQNQSAKGNLSTAAAAKRCGKSSRYIPKELKVKIWQRDQGKCQFVDRETKRKCEGTFALEIDHIQAFALGGATVEENLRLLCRAHNQFRATEI